MEVLHLTSFDREEVEDISLGILEELEEQGIDKPLAQVSIALTLGRLLSPAQPLDHDEGVAFVKGIIEWAKLYFADGGTTH